MSESIKNSITRNRFHENRLENGCSAEKSPMELCNNFVAFDCVQCVFHSCRNDVCQFLYKPVQSTAASVYLCQSVSNYYVFFDAFVCTLHFACIQIVKRLLVSPSIVRTFLLLIIFSFFLSGLCLMMKDAVCITLTTRLTPPLKGRLL